MGRALRVVAGGFAYHVLNRANARMRIFDKLEDYEAFERILVDAVRRFKMRLLSYCVMPNHWHLVVWPREAGDLSAFVGWLTLTHTQRWHAHRHSVGSGHVYQGRFKSFLIESDEYLWTVCRYVERNALRAALCERAEKWRWSSLWRREFGDAECQAVLSKRPIDVPKNWASRVNRAESQSELEALRRCVNRGQPFGSEDWVERMTKRFGLDLAFRPRGRPRNEADNNGS
ncbi:MAG: transposase [Thermoguttaceae bacterium]